MKNLNELHSEIIQEIKEEHKKEIDSFLDEKKENDKAAEKKQKQAMDLFSDMGLDIKKYESFQKTMETDNANQLKEIRQTYVGEESAPKIISPEQYMDEALNAAIASDKVQILPPAYAGVFSTTDEKDKLSGGTGTDVPIL